MRHSATPQAPKANFPRSLLFLFCLPPLPYIFLLLLGLIRHPALSYFKEVSRSWQGALGGGFTLEAALLGAYFIQRQITRDDRADREAQERRLQAELAVLPMLLSDLIDYLEKSARDALKLLDEVVAGGPAEQPAMPIRLDGTIISQIRNLVEGGDPQVTKAARILLKKLQVFGSRLADLARSHGFPGYMPPNRWAILGVLAGAAELHAIVESLFPFAREELDAQSRSTRPHASVTLADIHGSARKMLSSVPDVDGLTDAINRRFGHDRSEAVKERMDVKMTDPSTTSSQPPAATAPIVSSTPTTGTESWLKRLQSGLGEPESVSVEFGVRMTFTAAFWLVATFLASRIDGTNISAPTLLPSLMGFFKEQVELPMVLFQLMVLGLVALPALFFTRSWQREIKREVFRLYYTMSAVAGALSVSLTHWSPAVFFYGLGMIVPWLFVRLRLLDLD